MNVDKLVSDLNELDDSFNEENNLDEFFSSSNIKLDNERGSNIANKGTNYYSIFNIKNEYKGVEINAEKIQIDIIKRLIFLLKLYKNKRTSCEIIKHIFECLYISFESKNDMIKNASDETVLYTYKEYLLKNKFIILKIIRKIKNKHLYPDIKQIIKDVTRDIFTFNSIIYNGSLGFERITYLLYKLLNKNFKCKFKNFLLTFFLFSIMSRTNNSVDILYILEYYYKNDNFSFIIPDTSFISPCDLTVCNDLIVLNTNIRYYINIEDDDTNNISYNCYNIIYIQESLISHNFYLYIYKTLLKQEKYYYLFNNKNIIGNDFDFFNINSNISKLKSPKLNSECVGTENAAKKIEQINKTLENFTLHNEIENNLFYHINSEIDEEILPNNISKDLDSIDISSQSTYSYNDNEMNIDKINAQNCWYMDLNDKKNFFYQYLIIELNH
ncbi:conserved Plasmodium protein, unknown function [Plasmodium berghei]|uniref:Uncharacterized protein n=2 Tax=Plasmodium berghei TaxID=5821 RepID=A0A509AJ25_PLABA|nr:conserved Plasmodium protein, unknown function [Plasmodium berghei ANKA]SCM21201.1 conserved Plasmodium protein, unknown function [Plasmodium berghei]SCN24521.1 conserved Plasmodium protein, unknown function [Plasmodium berghei]SCO59699.1 conserved Plasmodium protein, unknown function [Plasmodium berghei]SCO60901.1 conserved Plasmodium protein, unknown function [Plasmodium berghei]VUC55347.1 conserved Plasmodium protein, unknown function [Plasmodium berghei ANKA]|eukprot:XP_034421160.1 conserved Plasmodium protein, unknown function [Plasmodium berghei ANKA]